MRKKSHTDHVFFTPFCLCFSHCVITFEHFPLPSSGHPIFCNHFCTSSTSVAPIYLYLTPHCLYLLMNIKRGWSSCFRRLTDFKHVTVSTSSKSPSCCCVCLLLFQTASFSAITFPMNIRRLFKWRCRACAYVHARSSSQAHSQYLREPINKRQLTDFSKAFLSVHDEQNGKCVLSCSSYLYQL